VFEIIKTPSGYANTPTTLVSFNGTNGSNPIGDLIADASGNLFGATNAGGAYGVGTVFEIIKTPSGYANTPTTLVSFNGTNGSNPLAGLIADASGNLFGTTAAGGAHNAGTVYELTGTGFATSTPFAAFKAKLAIDLDEKPNHDVFRLRSEFILGKTSNGIDPPNEAVTLQLGPFTATIPAGSFNGHGYGPFFFEGAAGGAKLKARIAPTGANRFAFFAKARDADLGGITNPVPVTLTIGDDSGTATVKADIGHEKRIAEED
jgi:uncharacterized repeat protein (TIGR03803 family)